jgi:tRNA G10  N-methylase Trm11
MLADREFSGRILDPFAGTGKVHALPYPTVGVELEPEWATMHPDTIMASALDMPFSNNHFDAVVTSPCYGNRMADHHEAKDTSRRNTYRHALGRALHEDNAGQLQWGDKYRQFHKRAWAEVNRVTRLGGLLILNISDHIRKGALVPVTAWHFDHLIHNGWAYREREQIATPRLRQGANHALRCDVESIMLFVKVWDE